MGVVTRCAVKDARRVWGGDRDLDERARRAHRANRRAARRACRAMATHGNVGDVVDTHRVTGRDVS